VKSTTGSFELETPRDRAGSFEPQLVKKHQRSVSDEIEILSVANFYFVAQIRGKSKSCHAGSD
jgi:hypothetical protein